MNILLINHYAGSLDMGMEYRPYYLGREWVKKGHEVTILCASFAHVRKIQPDVIHDFQEETLDGIRYVFLRTPRYKGNSFKRILNMFVFVMKLLRNVAHIVKNYNPDVVIASSTYPLDNYPVRKIARKAGAKHVYEVHDLWPLSPLELGGYSKHHPFIRIMQRAENFACKNTDLLISMLPKTLGHLKDHGLEEWKWHYIPNGIVLSDWEKSIPPPEDYSSRLKSMREEGFRIIGYTGSIGLSNALDNLVHCAHLLKDEPYKFILVGDGPEKIRLEKKVQDRHLDNIHFFPPVPKGCLKDLFHWFDGLFIGWQRLPLYRFGVSPNKLLDYMMAGKPVIHAVEAGNDLVQEAGCGISVEAENPDALAGGMRELFKLTQQQRDEMGRRGKEYVIKHHDYRHLAEKMIRIFQSIDGENIA